MYGFHLECKSRYSVKVWRQFVTLFDVLPVAAIINDKILCMHGGISPHLTDFNDVRKIIRPSEVPECGLMCDILWSDP